MVDLQPSLTREEKSPEMRHLPVTPWEFSTPDAIRTRDPRIRNPVLYPSELRGLVDISANYTLRRGLSRIEFFSLLPHRPADYHGHRGCSSEVLTEVRHTVRNTFQTGRVSRLSMYLATVSRSCAIRNGLVR